MNQCQNCKTDFRIEPEDFEFYKKMKVPSPTWCPECRMKRRFLFFNRWHLFRKKDARTGKEIFSGIPPQSAVKIYDRDYWWSDAWDAADHGRDYDFSRPFFEQFRELLYDVPWPSRNTHQLVNSDYVDNAGFLKNCYLCFDLGRSEDCAYVVRAIEVKDSLDCYETFRTQLSYENYLVDGAYRVLFSVNCEGCTDVWFSRNCFGCSNCFGCVNLRGKSYHIFNEPQTRESYEKFMAEFRSGSYAALEAQRARVYEFWLRHPMKFTISVNTENSTGEHIERSKNLKQCYAVHEGEDLAYCQFVDPPSADLYDVSYAFAGLSNVYDTAVVGFESYNLKFCLSCWMSNQDQEYSAYCHSSSDLFGCVSLRKKQYCILNKQYSRDDFFALREKIIRHMAEMPYTDERGHTYTYGEFFPPSFSPFAYNETVAHDFFPATKDEAEKGGYVWRESEAKEYHITRPAADLSDDIADVGDDITKEAIGCASCKKAYRIIPSELDFYRRLVLPLPRLCPACRFRERSRFANPPQWWPTQCQCAGHTDDRILYRNAVLHPHHGSNHCNVVFQTSFAPGRLEIIYCEQCYQAEIT